MQEDIQPYQRYRLLLRMSNKSDVFDDFICNGTTMRTQISEDSVYNQLLLQFSMKRCLLIAEQNKLVVLLSATSCALTDRASSSEPSTGRPHSHPPPRSRFGSRRRRSPARGGWL
jgi:hypothetical protein